ncbi:MAG: sulfatase-like hydrolase/transferase, partial [Thermoanaerobaculia bacterium]
WVAGCNGVWGYGGTIPEDREDLWKSYLNYYINCVRDVDRHLGTVLDAVDWDNTVVIFTADHGEMAGCHGMRHKGSFVYKENVGVPFIVCHPDVVGGQTSEAQACHIDLAPTLLSLAGVEGVGSAPLASGGYVGHDLTPILEDVSRTTARGSAAQRGTGALFTSDTLSTVDWDYVKASGESGAA